MFKFLELDTIKNQDEKIASALEYAEAQEEDAEDYIKAMDHHDEESTEIHKRHLNLKENATNYLGVKSNIVQRNLPRLTSSSEISDRSFLEKEIRSNANRRMTTTTNRRKDPLGKIAFPGHIKPQDSDKEWKLVFACLKPLGHERAWEVVGFSPQSFKTWWWKGRESDVSDVTRAANDLRTLARKVFCLTNTIASDVMKKNSLHYAKLNSLSEKSTGLSMYLNYLFDSYDDKLEGIQSVFESAVPITYVLFKIMEDALSRARGAAQAEPFQSPLGHGDGKIERRLNEITPLFDSIWLLLTALARSLGARPTKLGEFKEASADIPEFSLELIAQLSEPITEKLVEQEDFRQTEAFQTFVDNVQPIHDVLAEGDANISLEEGLTIEYCDGFDIERIRRLGVEEIEVTSNPKSSRIDNWLGEGSFGTVWKMMYGERPLRYCAVKMPLLRPGAKNRVMRELEAWVQFDDKHILPLLGFTLLGDNPLPCLISPLCRDNLLHYLEIRRTNIEDFNDKTSTLSPTRRLRFLHDIMSGLLYLHEKGFAHGDLRAANVLVRQKEGEESVYAVLCDFGLSNSIEDVRTRSLNRTTAGQRTNEAWLSPELMTKKVEEGDNMARVSQPGDIWAFGCVFLEVQYGTEPYEDEPRIFNIQSNSWSLPAREKGITPSHWRLMTDCWNEEPNERLDIVSVELRFSELMDESTTEM